MAKEKQTVTIKSSFGRPITITTGNKKILEALNKGRHDTAYNIYISDMKLGRRLTTKSEVKKVEQLIKEGKTKEVSLLVKERGTKAVREEFERNKFTAIHNNIRKKFYGNDWNAKAQDLRSLGDSVINDFLNQLDSLSEAMASNYNLDKTKVEMRTRGREIEQAINKRIEMLAEGEKKDRARMTMITLSNQITLGVGESRAEANKRRGRK